MVGNFNPTKWIMLRFFFAFNFFIIEYLRTKNAVCTLFWKFTSLGIALYAIHKSKKFNKHVCAIFLLQKIEFRCERQKCCDIKINKFITGVREFFFLKKDDLNLIFFENIWKVHRPYGYFWRKNRPERGNIVLHFADLFNIVLQGLNKNKSYAWCFPFMRKYGLIPEVRHV